MTGYAIQAREEKSKAAHAMGIDDDLISVLVEAFYARIRSDPMLGPIFVRHIDQWPHHLARMRDFWASIALESGRFHGNPMLKHIAIAEITPDHFSHWLNLWRATLADLNLTPEAAGLFEARAARIAESLQFGISVHRDGCDGLRAHHKGAWHEDGAYR